MLRTPGGHLVLIEIGTDAGRAHLTRIEVDGRSWGRGEAKVHARPKGASRRVAGMIRTLEGRGIGLDETSVRALRRAIRLRIDAAARQAERAPEGPVRQVCAGDS